MSEAAALKGSRQHLGLKLFWQQEAPKASDYFKCAFIVLLAAVSEFCLNKQKKKGPLASLKSRLFPPLQSSCKERSIAFTSPLPRGEHRFGRMPSSPAENQHRTPEGSPHWLTRADRQMNGPTVEL